MNKASVALQNSKSAGFSMIEAMIMMGVSAIMLLGFLSQTKLQFYAQAALKRKMDINQYEQYLTQVYSSGANCMATFNNMRLPDNQTPSVRVRRLYTRSSSGEITRILNAVADAKIPGTNIRIENVTLNQIALRQYEMRVNIEKLQGFAALKPITVPLNLIDNNDDGLVDSCQAANELSVGCTGPGEIAYVDQNGVSSCQNIGNLVASLCPGPNQTYVSDGNGGGNCVTVNSSNNRTFKWIFTRLLSNGESGGHPCSVDSSSLPDSDEFRDMTTFDYAPNGTACRQRDVGDVMRCRVPGTNNNQYVFTCSLEI